MKSLPVALCALCLVLAGCDSRTDAFHESDTKYRVVRESLYNRIIVERDGDIVDLRFRVGESSRRQTAIDLSDPTRLVVPYTRIMLAPAFVQPNPQRILQIGLGGASLNRVLVSSYPEARIQTVEIDPEVLAMARAYMGYETSDRDEVVIEDGRTFLKRQKGPWDWILVDAFRGGATPLHLKSREFYQLLRDRLAPGGAVAFNLHSGTKLFLSDLATIRDVFPQVHLFPVTDTGNVVVLAFTGEPPEGFPSSGTATGALRGYLEEAKFEYAGPPKQSKARVLTDDFIPAESLQEQSAP